MRRVILMQIAVALSVVLFTVVATSTVLSAVKNNGNGLTFLSGNILLRRVGNFLNGNNNVSDDSGGSGLRITVLPAPTPDEEDSDATLYAEPLVTKEHEKGLDEGSWDPGPSMRVTLSNNTLEEQVISNILRLTVKAETAPLPPIPTPGIPDVEPPEAADHLALTVPPGERFVAEFDEGRFRIVIPEGALKDEAVLHITLLPESDWPKISAGVSQIAAMYQVHIAVDDEYVTEFGNAILAIFRVYPEDTRALDDRHILVFYWDEALEAWLALPTDIGTEDGWVTITAITDHLTMLTAKHDPDFPVMTDLAGHWGRPYILRMASLRLVEGYPDETFKPEREVTRAEFAKMMVESLRLVPVEIKLPFTDEIAEWAVPYVKMAVHAGLFEGYSDGTFRPEEKITREQMAAVLARAVGARTDTDTISKFEDADEISAWAREYVYAAAELGLLTGYPDGTFRPMALTTRAESCTVFWRVVDLMFRK